MKTTSSQEPHVQIKTTLPVFLRRNRTALVSNCFLLALALTFSHQLATAQQLPVNLGGAAGFGVLAGTTVTSTGGTIVNGDLGVSPGTAITGFFTVDGGPGTVNGTIYNATPGPAALAQAALTLAYNDAASRSLNPVAVAGNLGGMTLTPGLYKSTSSLEISSGNLTLDAQGNPNAVFIFQMASTLTTSSGLQVLLAGGADAANIFWQVGSSATLGTTSVVEGNILALTSISLATGARLDGRALARNGAVTLDANTINLPTTVPEPGPLALCALGFGLFAWSRKFVRL